jgi:hypothetical protein
MDNELLQSFISAGQEPAAEQESSRVSLYRQASFKDDKNKKKDVKTSSSSQPQEPQSSGWVRKKDRVVIEQRKLRPTTALAIDECYCDKDRAASVSFGYLDIKHELKQKKVNERAKVRITPDDDSMAFYIFGLREIKAGHLDSAVYFISKVDHDD